MKQFLLIILLFAGMSNFAQEYQSNKREKVLYSIEANKSYKIDSLSIAWTTFQVFHNGIQIDSNLFNLKPLTSRIEFKQNFDSLLLKYRVFSFHVKDEYYTVDSSYLQTDPSLAINPFRIIGSTSNQNPWSQNTLNKNGSLSRGISFGNNQDMNVSSNMNIQLNGNISEDISIKASINDESIPFQPEGNTQKLQEFDKVFIELNKGPYTLIAGDYFLNEHKKSLMSFDKKAQGISFRMNTDSTNTHFSAAVSRGKFSRNQIQGVEGNQGPYRLTGANNEQFIIILSGTERIFIDGQLLERGMNQDYIIDYNTAEITFTANQLITKDKRIIAEFQYTDQRYARSLLYFDQNWNKEKWNLSLGIYSEQDSKNQPLQQNLSADDKITLSNAGDNLLAAFTPNIDSVEYSNTQVLYAKIDSTIGAFTYTDVYVYSTHPDSANYRLGFSYVGENNGNYVLANLGTNGRVYQWIEPVNGSPQGNYEPIVLLLPPEKKQVVDLKGSYKLNSNVTLYSEAALSNNDRNTFSELDSDDNTGTSVVGGVRSSKPLKRKNLVLFNDIRYQYIQQEFSSVERIRSIEFARDWNINLDSLKNDDHQINYEIGVKQGANIASVNSMYYFHKDLLNAVRIGSKINWKTKNQCYIKQEGSYINNSNDLNNYEFIRQRATVSKGFGPLKIQLKDEVERNVSRFGNSDSISANSYSFNHWRASLLSNDTMKTKWELYYGGRIDERSNQIDIITATNAQEYGGNLNIVQKSNAQIQLNSSFRQLEVLDTNLTNSRPDETFVNRANMKFQFFKNAITTNTFYELGSGQELKREFYYVQVPVGSGTYTWIDYNENDIQELNEFEIALFQDQAEYIRVWRPTNDYVATFSNQFNQSVNIDAGKFFEKDKGFSAFMKRFNDQFSYRSSRKTVETDILSSSNPFNDNIVDSNLISLSSSLRNVLFFNRSNPWFGLDYVYQRNSSKTLLSNGFNGRSLLSNELNIRWNFTRKTGVKISNEKGLKRSSSDFFDNNNYLLDIVRLEPEVFFQPNVYLRLNLKGGFIEKRNIAEGGEEFLKSQKIGFEGRYVSSKHGSFSGNFNYALVDFNAQENTPIAFDMLEGLKSGKNYIWGVQVQKNLNKSLQLSVQYNGRKTGTNNVIHNGGMQVRAIF